MVYRLCSAYWSPKKSVLQKTISAIRAQSWEALNRTLISYARQEMLEMEQRRGSTAR